MTKNQLQSFREGFCEKAAELGLCPSELLSYRFMKKRAVFDINKIIPTFKDIANLIKDNAILVGTTGLLGGVATGALGSYLYNQSKFNLDPEGSMLSGMTAIDEAKKLHLMAKYRNAVRQLKTEIA
jgi:hypothetical protein